MDAGWIDGGAIGPLVLTELTIRAVRLKSTAQRIDTSKGALEVAWVPLAMRNVSIPDIVPVGKGPLGESVVHCHGTI